MDVLASAIVNIGSPIFWLANLILKYKSLDNVEHFDPSGKVIVITGASSGIGEEIAKIYSKKGAQLVLVARRINELNRVASICRDLGAQDVVSVQADVTSEFDIQKIVKTSKTLGNIDCLILNAGISMNCAVSEFSDTAEIKKIMETNFFGAANLAYYALPSLLESAKAGGGRIVVISSVHGLISSPFRSVYCASKFALKGFFDSLRQENPSLRITIAYPGYVQTDLDRTRIIGKTSMKTTPCSPSYAGQHSSITSDVCARWITSAIEKNQNEAILELKHKIVRLLRDFFPFLVDYLVLRHSKDRQRCNYLKKD